MGPKIKAIIDSGPLIHLKEIGAQKALSVFDLSTVGEVLAEVKALPVGVKEKSGFDNNLVQLLQNEFGLGIAEGQCIALAKATGTKIFLTDDLDARTTAISLGLEPHGTVGILLKAYRQKVFSRAEAIGFVEKLKTGSTLYITTELVQYILGQIREK